MMAAAAAWNNTAAELSTTAAACQSVISELTDGEWLGPSSVAMATAVPTTWAEEAPAAQRWPVTTWGPV